MTRPASYEVAFYVPWTGALIAPGGDAPPGGAETQIYLLARGLAARDRRVCLIVYETAAPLPERIDGVDIVVRSRPRWEERPGTLGKMAEVAAVGRTIAGVNADVFVQRGTSADTGIVALAAKARRRPFVYSSANTIDFDWGRVAGWKAVRLFELGVRLADAILVQTYEQAELCEARFGRSPVVIKSIAERAAQRSAEPEAFLWMGKLASYKRPMAFVDLARAVPEARFRMVGVASEKDSPELATQVSKAAADVPNLELLAARPRAQLMTLVDSAVAIVNTSEFEGMPNTLLEGWSRGVPALVLAHDPDQTIERERVGCFAHGSPSRLAEMARELWRSRAGQVELSARCREYIRREHSFEAVADRWSELLGQVARRDPIGARPALRRRPGGGRRRSAERVADRHAPPANRVDHQPEVPRIGSPLDEHRDGWVDEGREREPEGATAEG